MRSDDLAVNRNAPHLNWHRQAVGGMWEEIGKLQFDFLVEHGLEPFHFLLDVGCGSLRGGVHFISYLESEHYFGIDKSKELLCEGREVELKRYGLTGKTPVLVEMHNFEFSSLKQNFEYALAQSVFTHLPVNSIIRCIMNVENALTVGGRFYATFFENRHGKFNLKSIVRRRGDEPEFASYFDNDPYHYDFETFRWVCNNTRLDVEYIGDWGHPGDQKMLVFIRF